MRSMRAPSLTLPLRSNPTLLAGVLGGCGVVLLASTQIGGAIFHTRPLDPLAWVVAFGFMPLPFCGAEAVKRWGRRTDSASPSQA